MSTQVTEAQFRRLAEEFLAVELIEKFAEKGKWFQLANALIIKMFMTGWTFDPVDAGRLQRAYAYMEAHKGKPPWKE